MPVTRDSAGASVASTRRTVRLLNLASIALAVLFVLFAVVLLLVRFVVLPQVPNHREQLVTMLSARIGAPVSIDALSTGWDGWNPKVIVDGLRVGERGSPQGPPLLDLPHVELVASWISLPLLQLRLKTLLIERPQLAVRRDAAGRIHVAGLEIDPAATADDSTFTDWLLRQREIVVRDALITWNDELRDAPQLVLDNVQFRLENDVTHHRFGLTGVPPRELASPLDLRGDVVGASLADWLHAKGDLYLRLDYADVAAWEEWIPMPVQLSSGKGALRMWFDFGGGVARSITSDIELADVSLQMAAGLPPLELTHLAGRLDWRQQATTRTVQGHGITFATHQGSTQAPTDFAWTTQRDATGATTGGTFSFARVDLAPLAAVGTQLPLPADWRKLLVDRAPRGALVDGNYQWQGSTDAPSTWRARAAMLGVGLSAEGRAPGAANVSGSFDVADGHGTLHLASAGATLDAPHALRAPLVLDHVDGDVTWQRAANGLQVTLANLAVANADIAASVNGTWQAQGDGPGSADFKVQLAHASVARVLQYPAPGVGGPVHDWFLQRFTAGTLTDAHIAVAGNVAEFPFAAPHHGTFTADGKFGGVTFAVGPEWPPFTAVDGMVRVDRMHVATDITRGHVTNATVSHATVEVPDFSSGFANVNVDIGGDASSFLDFVAHSPVAGWVEHYTDDIRATADGRFTAQLAIPLTASGSTRMTAAFTFNHNDVTLPGAPALYGVAGTLRFDELGMVGGDLDATAFGGPTKITVSRAPGSVLVSATGAADLATLRRAYPLPLVDRISGRTDWQFTADIRKDNATWAIDAPLKGTTIDLPVPLAKSADTTLPVHIERRAVPGKPDQDVLTLNALNTARLTIYRHLDPNGDAVVERALALVGKATEKPGDAERAGAWIRAVVPAIDLDEWWAIRAGESAVEGRPVETLRLAGIEINAGELTAMDRIFHGVQVNARSTQDNWELELAGTDLEGSAQWQAPTPTLPNGRLVARLARLTIPQAPEPQPAAPSTAPAAAPPHVTDRAARWPELDIDAARFISKGHELGRLELRAQPAGSDWLIQKLDITNDGGKLAATGRWSIDDRRQQTEVKAHLDTHDAGAFLARFGYPESIKGAPTQIDGALSWAGAPSDFDYPTLSGTLQLKTGAGQFTKIDPGMGKLLGVLSLQALPRRITLDFRDIFTDGFAFDEATGKVRIAAGVLHTDDLVIVGPAARVTIRGDADLAAETQQLVVRVQPSLATSFSAGTAGAAMLLLAANPVVAAAVGAGTLLAQKVLQDPIETLFSYEYRVTGSWTDPVVGRVDARKVTEADAPRPLVR
jgi:uncharacterized protein (TIGR02099 family)